jgi:hypothetical protein
MTMSEKGNGITRREFIGKGIKGVALVGLGSAIGTTASDLLANSPDYDLDKLSVIEPALIKYREAGKIETVFRSLHAVAIGPEDRIYLAADKSIQVFDKNAVRLSELKLSKTPECLTITEDGTVYVGMRDRVEVYGSGGERKASWNGLGNRAVLTSIAVSENDVFVADAGNRVILRYDVSGKLVRRIGERDESRNIPGFVVPSPYFDVAVSADGLLRVANPGEHRVEAYTFDGDFEFSWGNPSVAIDGFCGCCNPVNFAIIPDGRFVTCEKGLPRIKVYGADGSFESVVAGPKDFLKNAKSCNLGDVSDCQTGGMDIAVDSSGRVIVMDPVEKMIRIFEPTEET